MTTKASTAYPVNELGEIVATAGQGTSNVVGYLNEGYIPVDDATGKMAIVGLGSNTIGLIPNAVSDPLINYNNIMAAVTQAGVGGTVTAPFGQTYTLCQQIVLLDRQTLRMNGSTLKLMDQVSTTISAASPATITSVSSNPTVTFTVTSSSSFFVGQSVTIDDQTVANTKTYFTATASVISIPSPTSITVQINVNSGSNFLVSSLTTTNIETAAASYTVPNGAKLVSLSGLLSMPFGTTQVVVQDLVIDGNAANNPLGNRWETCCMLNNRSADSLIRNVRINTCPADGIYLGNIRHKVENIWIDKPNAMGFHIGASSGSVGGSKSVLSGIFIDSPGMGTPQIGHYGGMNAARAAYPAIGFSLNTDHVLVTDFVLRNSYSAPYAQGIGSITTNTNFKLQFENGFIDDMVYGAFQLGSSSSVANEIDFNQIHVTNCTPTVLNQAWNGQLGSDAWFHSYIGNNSSAVSIIDNIRLRNCSFVDSPLGIQAAANVELSDCHFKATTVAKSCALYIQQGAAVTDTTVFIDNVRCERPIGNGAGAPAANQFAANLYVGGGTIRGNNLQIIGGHFGARVQGGADFSMSLLKCVDNYSYGLVALSATTKVHLQNPVIRINSGVAAASPYAGIDFNSGGGAGYSGFIINPDIEIATTNSAQYGIRLSAQATAGNCVKVQGGIIKVTGTSTTPLLSGGATALNVIAGTVLSHAFSNGAAEVSSGTVVSSNI